MEVDEQVVTLDAVPASIERSVKVLEQLLARVEADVSSGDSFKLEQRISKITAALKTCSTEARQWAKQAKDNAVSLSASDKTRILLTFLKRLPMAERRKAYLELVEHEKGLVDGVDLQVGT